MGQSLSQSQDVDTPHQRMWLANLRVGGQIITTPEAASAGLPFNYERLYKKISSKQVIQDVFINIQTHLYIYARGN